MKSAKFLNLFVTALILSIAVVGCRRNPYGVTPLENRRPGTVGNTGPGPGAGLPIDQTTGVNQDDKGLLSTANPGDFTGWPEDHEVFKAYTVHFDLDSSTVKSSEQSKIEAVADYMKKNPANALRIAGYCDERGTEEYNRSLGERRALALREYLANLGCNPNHILTVTFGEANPVDPGHNEAAWAKNRRGEFILLTPPK